ncbi:MAG: hypothetical protein QW530_02225 [Candidatus Micrarchaeaceae archaeon]
MENENGIGQQKSLDEIEKEIEAQRQESMANSRFRVIEPGKQAILHFTGKVYERVAQIGGAATKKLDFELEEKTPSGQNKVFSVGSKSATARVLVAKLKAGKLVLSVSRRGSGTDTRYEVFETE